MISCTNVCLSGLSGRSSCLLLYIFFGCHSHGKSPQSTFLAMNFSIMSYIFLGMLILYDLNA
jgi:hypothetical protein